MDTKLYNTILLVCFAMLVLAIVGTIAFPQTIAPLYMGAVATVLAVVAALVNKSIIEADKDDKDNRQI